MTRTPVARCETQTPFLRRYPCCGSFRGDDCMCEPLPEDVEDGKPMTNGASFYTEDGA